MPKKPELTEVCWVCGEPISQWESYKDPYSPLIVGKCCFEALDRVNKSLKKIMPDCGLCHHGRDFKP